MNKANRAAQFNAFDALKGLQEALREKEDKQSRVSFRMASMIIAEIGDFNKFDSSDKILAFAGFSPSTYQSGKLDGAYAHMEKRGSPYLRYALYNAAKFVCKWEPVFGCYLEKKRAEGKHYNVAISHVVKKLVRVIYHLEKTGQNYTIAT